MKRTHLSRIRFAGGESYPPAQFIVRRNMKTKSLTKGSFAVLTTAILLLVALQVTAVFAADTGFLVASASANGSGGSGWDANYDSGRVSDDVYATTSTQR